MHDLIDSCPQDVTNTCDANGSTAGVIGADGGTLVTENGNVSMSLPAGALAEDVILTITDRGFGEIISTDLGEMRSLLAFDVGPDGTIFSTPVALTLHWQDVNNDGLVDGTNINEIDLHVSKDGVMIAGPCSSEAACDVNANVITVEVTSLSTFVLGSLGSFLYNPTLTADLHFNIIKANNWYIGDTLTLEIDDPGTGVGVDYTDTMIVVDNGEGYGVAQFDLLTYTLKGGDLVTVADGITIKTYTVANLSIPAFDIENDTISGTATPNSIVEIRILGEDGPLSVRRATTDASTGAWFVDFSVVGSQPDEGVYNLLASDEVSINNIHPAGDRTGMRYRVPWVAVNDHSLENGTPNSVGAIDWSLNTTLILTIDDPANGVGIDFSNSGNVAPAAWDPDRTELWFDLNGSFAIQPGHIITLTDGFTSIEFVVVDLSVTSTDLNLDTISGKAAPNSWVVRQGIWRAQAHPGWWGWQLDG